VRDERLILRPAVAALALCLLVRGAGAESPRKLVAALSSDDAVARFAAEEQLIAAGDVALDALERPATSRGSDPTRVRAIHIVAQIGTPRAQALLLRILEREPDVQVRGLVCRHLGRLGVEDAVPVIARWLRTIRGRPIPRVQHPVVLTDNYGWMCHADALREIGSETGIPVLEEMIRAGHGGAGAQMLMRTYREALFELQREQTFRRAARGVPGVEAAADVLFDFFRRDTLACIRLYRMKLVALGTEGRWVLEDLRRHPDAKVRDAAKTLLAAWPRLQRHRRSPT
jgi:hypothetical protein